MKFWKLELSIEASMRWLSLLLVAWLGAGLAYANTEYYRHSVFVA
jgi:hypothetical protein